HLMVDKDPKYISEVKQKITDFINQTEIDADDKKAIIQKVQSIQKPFDLMKYYYYAISKFEIGSTETEKESNFGLMDGPVDLGKSETKDGYWPSVQWMPRGEEEKDLEYADNVAASLKIAYLKIYNYLKPKIKRQKIASNVQLAIKPEARTYWWEDKDGNVVQEGFIDGPADIPKNAVYQNLIDVSVYHSITSDNGEVGRFETTINCIEPIVLQLCNHQGWKLTDAIIATANTCERCLNILLEQTTGEPYLKKAESHTHCEHCAEIDPEYNKQYLAKNSSEVIWLYKTAEPILDEFQKEIAAEYGAQYNSALRFYENALQDGHEADKAFQYALSEMQRVNMPVKPDMLLEVIKIFG
ncbi:MAG: hypothetical protein ACREBJ_12885, partial [Nitrosotalea sp.]